MNHPRGVNSNDYHSSSAPEEASPSSQGENNSTLVSPYASMQMSGTQNGGGNASPTEHWHHYQGAEDAFLSGNNGHANLEGGRLPQRQKPWEHRTTLESILSRPPPVPEASGSDVDPEAPAPGPYSHQDPVRDYLRWGTENDDRRSSGGTNHDTSPRQERLRSGYMRAMNTPFSMSNASSRAQQTQSASVPTRRKDGRNDARNQQKGTKTTADAEAEVMTQVIQQVSRTWRRISLWVIFCELSSPSITQSSDVATEFSSFLQLAVHVLNRRTSPTEFSSGIQKILSEEKTEDNSQPLGRRYGGYSLIDAHYIVSSTAIDKLGLTDHDISMVLGLLMSETNKIVKKRMIKGAPRSKKKQSSVEEEADRWLAQANMLFQELDGWRCGLLTFEDINLLLLSQAVLHPAFRIQSAEHKTYTLRLMYGGYSLVTGSPLTKGEYDPSQSDMPVYPEAYLLSSWSLKTWLFRCGFTTTNLSHLTTSIRKLQKEGIRLSNINTILRPWRRATVESALSCIRGRETAEIEHALQDIVYHTVFTPPAFVFCDVNLRSPGKRFASSMGTVMELTEASSGTFEALVEVACKISAEVESSDRVLFEDWCTAFLQKTLGYHPSGEEERQAGAATPLSRNSPSSSSKSPQEVDMSASHVSQGRVSSSQEHANGASSGLEEHRAQIAQLGNDAALAHASHHEDPMKQQISSASQKLATLCDALLLADDDTRDSLMQELRECRNSYFGTVLSYVGGGAATIGDENRKLLEASREGTGQNNSAPFVSSATSTTTAEATDGGRRKSKREETGKQMRTASVESQEFYRAEPATIVAQSTNEPPLQGFSQRNPAPPLGEVVRRFGRKQTKEGHSKNADSRRRRVSEGRQKKTNAGSKPVKVPTAIARSNVESTESSNRSEEKNERFAAPTASSRAKKNSKKMKAKKRA
eukprot:gb/GECG01005097.1/.p1 GENE.gb/GECG01005097.1/~~gb/GECG01005097.1/.p1  ORF type:complete len:927 (+),score=131.70 gb/GECG01005097.1/:1-2781(+)